METQKLHLILNYYLAILMVAATAIFGIGLWRAKVGSTKCGLYMIVISALIALPAFVTGEMAGAKVAATYTGSHADALAAHKNTARTAFLIIEAAGIAALFGVFRMRIRRELGKAFAAAILAISIAACGMIVYTTILGRQVKWAASSASGEKIDLRIHLKENKRWHA